MRLQIYSDLHHEVWRNQAPAIQLKSPDVVVLAGDIHQGANAIAWSSNLFTNLPVIYVLGNHEAYGKHLDKARLEIAKACAETANVHLLDSAEYQIAGVRFLGTTLWTDFRLFGDDHIKQAIEVSERVLMDYKRIKFGVEGRLIRATDTIDLHRAQLLWLERKLSEPFDGKTVVVTHMAPSMKSISPRYATDLASAAFASNLDHLVERCDLWIHGHTHDSFDYRIGKGRVVCNPCGYINRSGGPENFSFSSDFIVDL